MYPIEKVRGLPGCAQNSSKSLCTEEYALKLGLKSWRNLRYIRVLRAQVVTTLTLYDVPMEGIVQTYDPENFDSISDDPADMFWPLCSGSTDAGGVTLWIHAGDIHTFDLFPHTPSTTLSLLELDYGNFVNGNSNGCINVWGTSRIRPRMFLRPPSHSFPT